MTKDTIITYQAGARSLLFSALDGAMWITSMDGVSGNKINIAETQGTTQVGSTLSSQSVQAKDITIEGAVLCDVEKNRRGILDCILPGVEGRLTFTQGGESWYINGVPSSTPEFSDGSVLQQFQFTLHCPYPYFRSTEDSSAQIAGLNKLFSFPCDLAGSWYISQYSGSLFAVVENGGGVAMGFSVIFTALTDVTNPEFYHVERGAILKINKLVPAGEKITISTLYGSKGVTIMQADGTSINGFKYLDIASDLNLQLDPGANTIRCDALNNREGLRVQIIMPRGVTPGL